MDIPNYVENKIKYQRALAEAKNPLDEAEVKAIYVSYGGKTFGESEDEVVIEEPVVEVPEEIVAEEVPEGTVVSEETIAEEETPVVE